MAVVADYYIGKTHITIKDDCIVSPEEQQKILKRCGEIAARQYRAIVKNQQTEEKTA
jgi:hypothetical protein